MSADVKAAPAPTAHRTADRGLDRWFQLGDGRRICYREFGASDGLPVIALHGTPGSRLKFAATHDRAVQLGLRLICPDRWGYGGSDAAARPLLAAYAADIEQLADGLGLHAFAVAGISALGLSPTDVETKGRVEEFPRAVFKGLAPRRVSHPATASTF